jgi:hypothetical protein
MKFIKVFILVLCVTSCAPIYVNYDYEKRTDFSIYKSYNFYDDMKTGLSGLDEKRLLSILETKLNSMGFSKSETPNFLIDISSNEFQENQNSTVGVGVGGGGGRGGLGGGLSIGIPLGQSNVNREIIIEFVDDSKTGLFWQAKSESTYNPKAKPLKREAKLKAIVDKVLAQYPPHE